MSKEGVSGKDSIRNDRNNNIRGARGHEYLRAHLGWVQRAKISKFKAPQWRKMLRKHLDWEKLHSLRGNLKKTTLLTAIIGDQVKHDEEN